MQAKILTSILVAALVAGCTNKPDESEKAARKAARIQRDESKLTEPIKALRHAAGPHEILSLSVPFKNEIGMVERQTCFVWRDAEYRTTNMQCTAPPAVDLD